MTKDDLKSLVSSMSQEEIYQLLVDIKNVIASSEVVDSIKNVFDSGHIFNFELDSEENILVDKIISHRSAPDNKVEVVFHPYGVSSEIGFAVTFDNAGKLIFDKNNTSVTFDNSLYSYFVDDIEDAAADEVPPLSFVGVKSITVCKLQVGTFDVAASTPAAQVEVKPVDNDKAVNTVSDNKIWDLFVAIKKWQDAVDVHRVVLDASRTFTFEDDYSSSKTQNKFSFILDAIKLDDEKKLITVINSFNSNDEVVINANDFINGTIQEHPCHLVVTNEDKTYSMNIRFMKLGQVLNLTHDTLVDVKNVI